jgi:diguanylate cyclase (GGDEF)-like protein/PAS domain S-box-containing protein
VPYVRLGKVRPPEPGSGVSLRREIAAGEDAPAEARQLVDQLDGAANPETLERARLLTSELVTNACSHGDGPIEVTVSAHNDGIELLVSDSGPGFTPADVRPEDVADAENGRGLLLVDLLSSQWSTGGEGAPWVWVRMTQREPPPVEAAQLDANGQGLLDIGLMLDSVKDFAICALDRSGRITAWRAGAERMTGHTHGDVVGRLVSDLYENGSQLDLALTLAAVVNEGRAEEERLLRRADGSCFHANIVITPIYHGGGTLRGFTLVARDISWRHRLDSNRSTLIDRLQDIALTDELTGLPNRRRWQEELDREMARARRTGACICVGMVDIDGFKQFNDTNGHQAGDELLRATAHAWTGVLRATDLLGRYGGDEFLLLLPDCPVEEAMVVIDRLRQATPTELTCSIGLTSSAGDEGPDAVLARADRSLYAAKHQGRNAVIVADAPNAASPSARGDQPSVDHDVERPLAGEQHD